MKVQTEGGELIELGTLETSPTIGITDYSKRVTDDFGVTTVVPRAFSRTMSVRLGLPMDDVDALQRRLADLRASTATWIADDRFQWLSARGFYKDFSLDLETEALSYCTLTVEGVAESEVVADTGGDPAVVGGSTLRLLQPAAITDAVLANSSVAETDAPQWSSGATYAQGARVIRWPTHRIYESVGNGNVGNDPAADTTHWLDVGPTNRWAMFDQALGTATSASGEIAVSLTPTAAVTGLALLDVDAGTVRVQAPGYDQTRPVTGGAVLFLDLVAAAGASIAVTVIAGGPELMTEAGVELLTESGVELLAEGTSSVNVSVGTLLIGRLVGLGVTEASPTAGITDYSKKDVDDFGNVTVVPRSWAKNMATKALIRTDAIDLVANRVAAVRAQPSLWIGDDGLDSLTIYGFFKDFSIEVGESTSKLSLSIEGLSTAAPVLPFLPPAIEVTWDTIKGPKPPITATDTRDPAAPIGPNGKTVEQLLADLATALAASGSDSADISALLSRIQAAARQGSPNLLLNGDFADGIAHWTISAGFAAGWIPSIGSYLGHSPGAGSAGGYPHLGYQDVPVVPGETYSASYEGNWNGQGDGHVSAEWWNGDFSQRLGILSPSLPRGAWGQRFACDPEVAPAGAVWLRIIVVVADAATSFDTSRFMVQKGPATDWRDDASQASVAQRTTRLAGDQAAYAEQVTELASLLQLPPTSSLRDIVAKISTMAQTGVDASGAVSSYAQAVSASFLALGGVVASKADATITQAAINDLAGKLAARITLAANAGNESATIDIAAFDGSNPFSVIYFKAGRFAFDGGDVIARTFRATSFVTDQGVDLAAIVPGTISYQRTGSDGSNSYTLSGSGAATPVIAGTAGGLVSSSHRVAPTVTLYAEKQGSGDAPFNISAQLWALPMSGGAWSYVATIGQANVTSASNLTLTGAPFYPGNLGGVYLGVKIVTNNNQAGLVANVALSADIIAFKG